MTSVCPDARRDAGPSEHAAIRDSRLRSVPAEVFGFNEGSRDVAPVSPGVADDNEPRLIAKSEAMKALITEINVANILNGIVLLEGPSGAGKEVVARELHRRSRSGDGPFYPLNMGGLNTQLATSAMFGHERGAFTGAYQRHRGAFESAHGGTLFLDEIADTPRELQAALLRVLQDGRVRRLGGESEIEVDTRVIAATNRSLTAMVEAGTFRDDLFQRLSAFRIAVPRLRERVDDLPDLVSYYSRRLSLRLGRGEMPAFSPEALCAMQRRHWRGNVRELIAAVERLLAVCINDDVALIEATHVEMVLPRAPPPPDAGLGLRAYMHECERRAIVAALGRTRQNVRRAASQLGVATTTLHSRMIRLGLKQTRPPDR